MLNRGNAKETFHLEPIQSDKMDKSIDLWQRMEQGKPPWADGEDVRSVAFSNTIARELASLIAQGIDVKIEGGANAETIQDALDRDFLRKSREVLEKMLRLGGVMAKWNGEDVEYLGPDRFVPIQPAKS